MKKDVNKKDIFIVLFILFLIIIDQIVKGYIFNNFYGLHHINIIKNLLDITYVQNAGGAYGIGKSNIFIIIIANIIVIGIMIRFIALKRDTIDKTLIYGISLIISGGISNLIDRIFRGYVIDYIDISKIIKIPVINFADIFITFGTIILGIYIVIYSIKNRRDK